MELAYFVEQVLLPIVILELKLLEIMEETPK
jgi:hypothetical protein